MMALHESDVEWVVNDLAELGVKIGTQFFFLYKGRSLSYADDPAHHEDDPKVGYKEGDPIKWRYVGKREFGECCHPVNYKNLEQLQRKAAEAGYRGIDTYALDGTVSLSDGNHWQDLPCAHTARISENTGKTQSEPDATTATGSAPDAS